MSVKRFLRIFVVLLMAAEDTKMSTIHEIAMRFLSQFHFQCVHIWLVLFSMFHWWTLLIVVIIFCSWSLSHWWHFVKDIIVLSPKFRCEWQQQCSTYCLIHSRVVFLLFSIILNTFIFTYLLYQNILLHSISMYLLDHNVPCTQPKYSFESLTPPFLATHLLGLQKWWRVACTSLRNEKRRSPTGIMTTVKNHRFRNREWVVSGKWLYLNTD